MTIDPSDDLDWQHADQDDDGYWMRGDRRMSDVFKDVEPLAWALAAAFFVVVAYGVVGMWG